MAYNTINFKSREILYAYLLNTMDGLIASNDIKILYLDAEIKKLAQLLKTIPSWAKEEKKPTYTASEVGTYSSIEIDNKLLALTKVDLSKYYTKSEVDNLIPKDYASISDLNKYVLQSELSDYVSIEELNSRNYITLYILDTKNFANKTYVDNKIQDAMFGGVDLSDYLTIDDASALITTRLIGYLSEELLQQNYYNKEEVDNLVLGGSLNEEKEARELGDADLLELINNLVITTTEEGHYLLVNRELEPQGNLIIVPKEKIYSNGITLVDNNVQLLLSDDEVTQANLKISNGALKFVGQLEEFLDIASNYTINGHRIGTNPTLGGLDIRMKDYEGTLITSEDTVNDAFFKIENQLSWGMLN